MTVKRNETVVGGKVTINPPSFIESLLMEILLQVIDPQKSRVIAKRAGFTDDEIKERIP